jgi:hypothetical protein
VAGETLARALDGSIGVAIQATEGAGIVRADIFAAGAQAGRSLGRILFRGHRQLEILQDEDRIDAWNRVNAI